MLGEVKMDEEAKVQKVSLVNAVEFYNNSEMLHYS